MENCYLSFLPRGPIRGLAGFSPDESNYYIRRDIVRPLASLSCQIFPQIEEVELKVSTGQFSASIALGAFLDLLKFFRRIILQDAAVLMDLPGYKAHPVFRHGIFQKEEFLVFKRYLTSKIVH
jgi:hypothetical protein